MSDTSESLLDEAILVALIVDRLAAAAQRKVAVRLTDLRGEISRLIVELDFTDSETPAAAAYQRDRVIEQASALIFAAYQEMMRQTQESLTETAQIVEESLQNKLGVLLGVGVAALALGRISDIVAATRIQGPTVTEWWGKQSGDTRFRFAATIHDAYGRSLGLQDVLRAVRGTSTAKYRDGILGPSQRHAEGLVMSAYHAVASAVRLAVLERHPEYIKSIMHLSLLDDKTTTICRGRSNRIWSLPDKKPIGHGLSFREPPLHWACRSHLVPILHAWRDMPEDVKARVNEDDLSGKPATEPDLDDWMNRNPQQAGPITLASARRQLGLK
jgi:hypothetical protein